MEDLSELGKEGETDWSSLQRPSIVKHYLHLKYIERKLLPLKRKIIHTHRNRLLCDQTMAYRKLQKYFIKWIYAHASWHPSCTFA